MNNRELLIFIVSLMEVLIMIGLSICLIIGLIKDWSIQSMIVISTSLIVINFNHMDRNINEGFREIILLIARK